MILIEDEKTQVDVEVDEDEVTGVEYGSSAKKGGAAAGNKVGTDALRIKLNTGSTNTAAGTGGRRRRRGCARRWQSRAD